jgi:hypothetical protein
MASETNESTLNYSEDHRMGALKKALCVFFSPARAFESINAKPNWLFPLLLVLAVTIVYQLLVVPIRIADTKDAVKSNPSLSAEQIDVALENIEKMTESPELHKRVGIALGFSVVGEIVRLFVVAGAFMLAVQIGLGATSFKKVLAVISHVNLITAIRLTILLPLAFAKKSLQVYTSLALVLPAEDQNGLLHRLLDSFDDFDFWRIFLFSIGLATLTGLSTRKSALLVVYVWVGWIVVYSSFGNLVRVGQFCCCLPSGLWLIFHKLSVSYVRTYERPKTCFQGVT